MVLHVVVIQRFVSARVRKYKDLWKFVLREKTQFIGIEKGDAIFILRQETYQIEEDRHTSK